MPKVIDNIRGRAISEAREILIREGYAALTIREIARRLGIGLGTIYNYFKDKESLMAAVMIQDWMNEQKATREELMQAESLREGLLYICRGIRNFCLLYQKAWNSYSAGSEFSKRYRERHEMLLAQITEIIRGLYERFDEPCEDHRITLYAELIIAGAQHPEIREEEIIEIIV